MGLSPGPVPPRVDANTKAGLLDLVDHAAAAGWSTRRAAGLLGVDLDRVARWRERKDQLNIATELPLILFDDHDVVTPAIYNGLGHLPLGQQGIHRAYPSRQNELAQHRFDCGDLIGLDVDRLLVQRQTEVVGKGRQQMDPRRALFARAPQRFPIEGDGGLSPRGRRGGTADDALGPGAQFRFEGVVIHVSKDGVERCGARGPVGKTQRMREPRAVIVSPFGDGTVAAIPT